MFSLSCKFPLKENQELKRKLDSPSKTAKDLLLDFLGKFFILQVSDITMQYINDLDKLPLTRNSHQRCSIKKCCQKFHKIYRKTPIPESLFFAG